MSKGETSEGIILAALLRQGENVLIPFGYNHRYDLVVDRDGRFIRVQCKSGRLVSGGAVVAFNACSTNQRGERRAYTEKEIDMFAVYCPAIDRIFYVPLDSKMKTTVWMRLDEPKKTGGRSGIRWAKDLEKFPF